MPGLLKIGVTEKVPSVRANELYTTGVPEPFTVEYYCLVEDARNVEKAIHSRLSEHRNQERREFFRVDLNTAIEQILQTCRPEHQWRRTQRKIKTLSRDHNSYDEREMDEFVAAATRQSLDGYVQELFYDSNSCTCTITFNEDIDESSVFAMQIFDIAMENIGQFEWFGRIFHGRGMKADESEF